MKTKKLIELLQKEDPTGEGEVCISGSEGNVDIFHLEWKPGYWDGCYQVLLRDWNCKFYNVIGAQYRSDGNKLCIVPMSIEDALLGEPELPIEVFDEFVHKTMADTVAAWRQESRKIEQEINDQIFLQVMKKIKEGWIITQPKEEKIGRYHVMSWEKGNEKHKLNQGECGIVLKSGFFQHDYRKDDILWRLVI
jgi:hypothetical protein